MAAAIVDFTTGVVFSVFFRLADGVAAASLLSVVNSEAGAAASSSALRFAAFCLIGATVGSVVKMGMAGESAVLMKRADMVLAYITSRMKSGMRS